MGAARNDLTAAARLFDECGAAGMHALTTLAQARLALRVDDRRQARRICRSLLGSDAGRSRTPVGVTARLLLARASDEADDAAALVEEASRLAADLGAPELQLDIALARARQLRRIGDLAGAAEELRRAAASGPAWDASVRAGVVGRSPSVRGEIVTELVDVLVERGDHASTIEAWHWASTGKAAMLGPLADASRGWRPAGEDGSGERVEELYRPVVVGTGRWVDPVGGPRPSGVPEGPILDYCVLGDDVVAFVIREGQVYPRRLRAVAGEVQDLLTAWRQECVLMVALGGRPDPYDDGTSKALDGLFDVLLAPLVDLLADLGEEPLEVLGDRFLHGIPFDALLDVDAPWRGRLVATGLLGEPIDLEPDPHGEPTEDAVPARVLVLAVPDEHAPQIRSEAATIASTFAAAEVHEGPTATREVLASRAAYADVVHIAAHGVFREGNALFSAVRLGDGWLPASELVDGGFDLTGRIVVLSACSSGLTTGQTRYPIGLPWACLAAGAEGVVAALWAVDDAATEELMAGLYRRIAAGADVRTALGQARREVARARPHPYYWAAFRLFSAAPAIRP